MLILLPWLFINSKLFIELLTYNPFVLIASVLCQVVYLCFLALAYRNGEMSIVYPLSRSLPILFAFGFEVLYKEIDFSRGYFIGILIQILGILFICKNQGHRKFTISIVFSIITAIAICGYTIFDHHFLSAFSQHSTHSSIQVCLTYLLLLEAGIALCFSLPMVYSSKYRESFRYLVKNEKFSGFKMAAGMTGAYGLVLLAMTFSSKASLVISFRQLSIPLAFMIGIVFLKEVNNSFKWFGMVGICLGLILVGISS